MKTKNSIRSCPAAIALAFGLLCPSSLYAFTEIYNTAGTFEWVCPPGVTSITVECWGGGGAGGGAYRYEFAAGINHAGGGGGGGGAYARTEAVPVTPGLTYTVTIPPAATNPLPVVDGTTVDGADVSFTGDSSVIVSAAGGKGGISVATSANVAVAGDGGHGGAVSDSIGDGVFAGGEGARQPVSGAGAGGGGAGDSEAGVSAVDGNTLGAPGGLQGGGNGGNGKTGQGAGTPGANAGGGGGGGRSQTVAVGFAGGTGGLGQIRLSDGVAFSSVKQDNSEDLSLPASWTDGVPGPADVAVWDSTVTAANTTLLGADLTWAGISIQNPGGLVTIDAGDPINTLTLGLAETDIDLSAATADLILNCNLALNAANVWDVQTERTLTLAGVISGAGSISKQGDGTAILSGANTFNAGTAGITIAAGTLQLGASNVIPQGAGRGNVFVNGTLDLNGFSETFNGLDGSGIVDTTAADGESTLTIGIGVSNSNFTGIIQNTVGTLNLIKSQSGTAQLSNANTFSGTATVDGGTLRLNNSLALQNVSGITLAGGTVTGGSLWITPDGTTLTPPITLAGGGTIISPSPADNEINTVTLNGAIGGTGDLVIRTNLNANTRPIVVLGAAGTYDGNTTINNPAGGTLAVQQSVANALPATTVLTVNNVGAGTGRYAQYDLNGFDQTLAGLTSTGAMANRAVISNSSATAAILTINNIDDYTFSGMLGTSGYPAGGFNPYLAGDNFSLTKGGEGTLTLTGVNTYNGDTTVSEGTLALAGGSQASSITVEEGGALGLVAGSPTTSSSSVDLSDGRVRIIGAPVAGTDQQLMTASGGFLGTPTLASPIAGFDLELRAGDTELWLVTTSGVVTIVIDLGEGTVIEGGTFIGSGPANLPLPQLPAGSILTSIAVNTILTATDNSNFASDLAVLLDPTPVTQGDDFSVEITNGNPKFGAAVTLGWPASANGGIDTALVDTKTSADWSALGSIDLATTGLFLGNAHGGPLLGGTWSGTITLSYLAPVDDTGYDTWATENVGGQGPELDFDGDGVSNGIEFFLNAGPGFTALPTLASNNTITWTNGGNIPASAYGTQFVIQTSSNLVDWTNVPAEGLDENTGTVGTPGNLSFTLTGTAPRFVRLQVTPE